MTQRIPQSTAKRVPFKAYLASDHTTEATGKTIAITISKNGGAFGNPSAGATNATEISSGWYYVDLSTTDTGTIGPIAIRGAAATIDDYGEKLEVVLATTGGYTNLANADVATSTRLAPTAAGRTLDVTATGAAGIDWANVEGQGTAVSLSNTDMNFMNFVTQVSGDVGGNVNGSVQGDVAGSIFGDVQGNVWALSLSVWSEPTGAPAADATLTTKIGFLYEALRNKKTVDGSFLNFYDDSNVLQWRKALSDDNVTFTEAKGA